MSALRKPRALRSGDWVGLCAPSAAVETAQVAAGVAALETLGLRVRVPAGLLGARDLYMAGSVSRRVDELHALLDDPDLAGVICVRGGAGALQLLPHLDLASRATRPKVFLGYSDATPLHLALQAQGWVTFHGPMVARDFAGGLADLDSFRAVVMGEGDVGLPAGEPLVALHDGEAEGALLGGCLSLLAALVGTPWALRPQRDTLLFVEDWNERPYRLERLLWQLRASGLIERVRGIVFGEMIGCEPAPELPYRLTDVLRRALDGFRGPVAFGLPSGHTRQPNHTLPLGVASRLVCASGRARFELLETGVEARP